MPKAEIILSRVLPRPTDARLSVLDFVVSFIKFLISLETLCRFGSERIKKKKKKEKTGRPEDVY